VRARLSRQCSASIYADLPRSIFEVVGVIPLGDWDLYVPKTGGEAGQGSLDDGETPKLRLCKPSSKKQKEIYGIQLTQTSYSLHMVFEDALLRLRQICDHANLALDGNQQVALFDRLSKPRHGLCSGVMVGERIYIV